MNKLLLSLCLSFLFTMVWAQREFQPGYFIKNNVKTECLIKNEGWYKSPNSFMYKLNSSDTPKTANVTDIQEFHIENTKHKYVSRLSHAVYNMPKSQNFIQVLVEGDASLFKYVRTDGRKRKENHRFRGQLFEDLVCEDVQKEKVQKLDFKQNDLVRIFNTYNICKNSEFTDLTIFKEKGEINLYILVGTSLFDVNTSGSTNSSNAITAPSNISIKAGVELEYILPIRNKKLSFFTGANYSKNNIDGEYKARLQVPSAGTNFVLDTKYEYDYDLLSIPLGFRFYMYLNQNHAFYINPGVSYNMILSENHYEFNYNNAGQSVGEGSLDDGLGFFTGIGYKFKSKFGAEIRFISARNIQIDDYTPNSTSLVAMISYNLF